MGLFGKKKEETASCCYRGNCTLETMAQAEAVKVLGSGCAKCNALKKSNCTIFVELGMDTTIDHVTDFTQIATYGVNMEYTCVL